MEGLLGDRNIILIGMPGAGKSTVGPLLAQKAGMDFIDTDDIIKMADGREPRDIVRDDGYEGFLELQQKLIISRQFNANVIATGGGVVKSDGLMQHLKKIGCIIFLDETSEVLESRLAQGRRLAKARGQTFKELFEERRPLYIKYSDYTVMCTGKLTKDIVQEIIAYVRFNFCSDS
jgi:shikimate kinase